MAGKKVKSNHKYRSSFERRLHTGVLRGTKYEPFDVTYTQTRKYKPDFVLKSIWFEAKGFFRPGDQAKYMAIRDNHPDIKLVFIFTHPYKAVRKGAKMTMARWADIKGFTWFGEHDTAKIERFIKENT
jgi:hypothetical protein